MQLNTQKPFKWFRTDSLEIQLKIMKFHVMFLDGDAKVLFLFFIIHFSLFDHKFMMNFIVKVLNYTKEHFRVKVFKNTQKHY